MPRRRSPKESSIVRSILDDLRSRGRAVWFRKVHGGPFGASGVPDIEVVFRPEPKTDFEKGTSGWIRESSVVGGTYRRPDEWKNPARAIVVFLEAKRPGEKPTALQDATMAAIRHAGADVRVVFSKKEAIDYLESLGIPPRLENKSCPPSSGRQLRLSRS